MTTDKAVALVSAYLKSRKSTRLALLAAARKRHPEVVDSETRKLHAFPGDLTDERLLRLATT